MRFLSLIVKKVRLALSFFFTKRVMALFCLRKMKTPLLYLLARLTPGHDGHEKSPVAWSVWPVREPG